MFPNNRSLYIDYMNKQAVWGIPIHEVIQSPFLVSGFQVIFGDHLH